jgi:hypothetical protein
VGIESLDSVSDPSISDHRKRFGAPAPENNLSVDGVEVRFRDHNLRELVALRFLAPFMDDCFRRKHFQSQLRRVVSVFRLQAWRKY